MLFLGGRGGVDLISRVLQLRYLPCCSNSSDKFSAPLFIVNPLFTAHEEVDKRVLLGRTCSEGLSFLTKVCCRLVRYNSCRRIFRVPHLLINLRSLADICDKPSTLLAAFQDSAGKENEDGSGGSYQDFMPSRHQNDKTMRGDCRTLFTVVLWL